MIDWRVPLADLALGPAEHRAVQAVLDSQWLSMGGVLNKFELDFASTIGARYAVGFTNATAALHIANLSLDIGPGDEVIVPSLSFVATANATLYAGAEVRFVDICGPDALTISPEKIEESIRPQTKAIVVMHYGGYPCDMSAIIDIARRHNLAIIEDAAHAPGAMFSGKHLGAWGDVGCFSFFSNKNIATGEGGMLVTNRDDVYEKARLFRSHGMTSLTWDRHRGHAYSYDVVELGYNYRLDELRAALGQVQLEKLNHNNGLRRNVSNQYKEAFQDTSIGIPFSNVPDDVHPAFHIFPILLPEEVDRRKFIDDLRSVGIQTSIHYPPIHKFKYYQEKYPGVILPITEEIAASEVTLPLFPSMTQVQIDLVISAVIKAING